MARLYPTKPTFASGILSERLHGRVDLEQYLQGMEECKNFVVMPSGGIRLRSGTAFAAEVKNSANRVRLLPFVPTTTSAYVIEAGPLYFRYFSVGAPVESGGSPVETVTPYDADAIQRLRYTQSADVMFLVDGENAPRRLSRASATAFTLDEFPFEDGPYLPINKTTTTLNPAGTGPGSVTINASATTGINDDTGFQSTDVGRAIRILAASGDWGWGKITAVSSTTQITVNLVTAVGATGATENWRLGAWSDTTGWPEVVAIHQQRLFFGKGIDLWGSETGNYLSFSPTEPDGTVADDNAVSYTISSGRIDGLRWIMPGRVLEAGTGGAEFSILGGNGVDTPLAPGSVRISKQAERGSYETALPVFTENGTVFVHRARKKLYNYYYSFQSDSYIVSDLTLLAENIAREWVREITYQAEPHEVIWTTLEDGELLGCTFLPSQNVIAWHRHEMGGAFGSGVPEVESQAVAPTCVCGSRDEHWLVVKRTVDGSTVRYIEWFKPEFDQGTDITDAWFLDSAVSYSGAATATITGLDHLEGQTVGVLGDGMVFPDQVVSSGEITLPQAVTKAIVGLRYTGTARLLPFEPGDLRNSLTANRSRVTAIGIEFFRTLLAKVGVMGRPRETIARRRGSDPTGEALQPRSEFVRVAVESANEYQNRIEIVQDQPLPCTILSVKPVIDQ